MLHSSGTVDDKLHRHRRCREVWRHWPSHVTRVRHALRTSDRLVSQQLKVTKRSNLVQRFPFKTLTYCAISRSRGQSSKSMSWACQTLHTIGHVTVSKCAQSLHALKLFRHHSLSDDSLRHVYKTSESSPDCCRHHRHGGVLQRLEASVRRAIRLGLHTTDDPTPSQLVADMDDNLIANILNNPHHVLHKFLRRHSLSLTVKTDCSNFLNRLLSKTFISCLLTVMVAFCQLCY